MFDREATILTVLSLFPLGRVQGRLKLQKAIYVLKSLGVPLRESFSFRYYGPYSDSLRAVLDVLESQELVQESVLLYPNGTKRYDTEITSKGRDLAKRAPPLEHALVQEVVRLIDGQQPQVLELAATFLWFQSGEHDPETTWEHVRAMKPDLWATWEHQARELLLKLGELRDGGLDSQAT